MENSELINQVHELKVLVVGDIMLDKYVVGDVERISPEAPVPIVDVTNEYYTLGGCGNVAKNLAKLETQTYCVAVTGVDSERDRTINLLSNNFIKPYLINDRSRPTTVKERIISDQRQVQLLRIDREKRTPVDPKYIITEINHILQVKGMTPDIIVVSDYHKGVISRSLMKFLEGIPAKLIIDPKPSNCSSYDRGFAITPNEKEYPDISEQITLTHFDNIIVTRGKDGVRIIRPHRMNYLDIPGKEVEVYNVTGAGDSFVAVFSVCVGVGMSVTQSAAIANECAAYVVTKPGTSTVPPKIFWSAVDENLIKENAIDQN